MTVPLWYSNFCHDFLVTWVNSLIRKLWLIPRFLTSQPGKQTITQGQRTVQLAKHPLIPERCFKNRYVYLIQSENRIERKLSWQKSSSLFKVYFLLKILVSLFLYLWRTCRCYLVLEKMTIKWLIAQKDFHYCLSTCYLIVLISFAVQQTRNVD